jgi:hypothetical protein
VKRYSKRVREEAALICAIAASGGVYVGTRYSRVYAEVFGRLGTGQASGCLSLASVAYYRVMEALSGPWTQEVDAEAEALIRTGWSPD